MSLPLEFRPATLGDLAVLAEIEAATPHGGWTRAAFESELPLAWSHTEVVDAPTFDRARPVAFLVYWHVAGEVELLNVAVDQRLRRRGIGRDILRHLVCRARELHAERILLEVRRSNVGARALYESSGFRETGVRPKYYAEGNEDAILMEYPVPPLSAAT